MIVVTLNAVCLLFGLEQSWTTAKKELLSDIHFLEKLINYDVDGKTKLFKKLRKKYIGSADFEYEIIKKQSEAAGQIYQWILAIDQF